MTRTDHKAPLTAHAMPDKDRREATERASSDHGGWQIQREATERRGHESAAAGDPVPRSDELH